MNIWVVRVVEDMSKEDEALRSGTCITGWDFMHDFRSFQTFGALKLALGKQFPAKTPGGIGGWASQIIAFRDYINVDDFVVMPSKQKSIIHVGVIRGQYEFVQVSGKSRHQRAVHWCGSIPKSETRDAHGSLRAFLSVFRVKKPLFAASVNEIVQKYTRT